MLGARKMVFHGLGPLGCIPSQRVKSKRGQCLNQVNQWILHFNARVQKLTTTLNRNLPSAQIAFADTYQAVLDLITNPTAYGNFPPISLISFLGSQHNLGTRFKDAINFVNIIH